MIDGPSMMRWVVGYEGLYLVHRDGYVVNRLARTMTTKIDRYGYANVRLNRSGEQKWKKIHRLVCEAWNGPAPTANYQAGHLDGDKLNNRPENLAWVTNAENSAHKKRQGRPNGGRSTSLSEEALADIRSSSLSVRKIAAAHGISAAHVSRIRNGLKCAPKRNAQNTSGNSHD